MTVRNANNDPVPDVLVEIIIDGLPTGRVGLCSNQDLDKYTDHDGVACFNIAGGGCYKHEPDAVVIRANGVWIRDFDAVMSSDYEGRGDHGEAGKWDLQVNPGDLAAFVFAYQGGNGPASCHDYNNNGSTDPPDLAVFVEAYKGGANFCTGR